MLSTSGGENLLHKQLRAWISVSDPLLITCASYTKSPRLNPPFPAQSCWPHSVSVMLARGDGREHAASCEVLCTGPSMHSLGSPVVLVSFHPSLSLPGTSLLCVCLPWNLASASPKTVC